MWSVWAICSFCPTPLEQAAQVLLPRHVREDTARAIKEAATPNAQKGDPASMPPGFVASREFVKCRALVGVATGMLLGTITAVVARHPHWLTPDTALYGIMASFTPYMMASLVMAGICIFLDGVLQAVGDLQYLCKSQAINVLALWLCLYGYVKQSGVGIIGVSLPPARLPPSSSSSHPLHLSPSHPCTPSPSRALSLRPSVPAPTLGTLSHTCTYTDHIHVYVHMRIHVHTHTHTYTCIHQTHARTYTHTHTHRCGTAWYYSSSFVLQQIRKTPFPPSNP